jgi:hypothetical protein
MIMTRYLLSTHTVEGEEREPQREEQMRETYGRLTAIEQEMSASGAWVFSARLHGRIRRPSSESPAARR